MFVLKNDFAEICDKIDASCKSIRKAMIVIASELFAVALLTYFILGISVGKFLCK